jgi:hypothetical protein
MKRISVVGWVGKNEKEMKILEDCEMQPSVIRDCLKYGLYRRKTDAGPNPKRVRVTVEIDVEVLK